MASDHVPAAPVPMSSRSGGDGSSLRRLSVVILARDEESCVARTVEHLHLELQLHSIPHEIVVVDDGSVDSTWKILEELRARIPEVSPVQSVGRHGFGIAVTRGTWLSRSSTLTPFLVVITGSPSK